MAKSGALLPYPLPTVALPPFAPSLYPSLLLSLFWGEEGPRHLLLTSACADALPYTWIDTTRKSQFLSSSTAAASRGGSCLDLRSQAKRASSSSAATPASLLCPPGGQSVGGGGGRWPSATAGSPMEGRVFNQFCRRSGLSPRWSDPG